MNITNQIVLRQIIAPHSHQAFIQLYQQTQSLLHNSIKLERYYRFWLWQLMCFTCTTHMTGAAIFCRLRFLSGRFVAARSVENAQASLVYLVSFPTEYCLPIGEVLNDTLLIIRECRSVGPSAADHRRDIV